MNTEKIEKLKKSLSNSKIPADLKPKIEAEIKRLESLDAKQSEPTPPVAKAPTVRKPRVKKVVAKKTVAPKKVVVGKTTAMSLAKEIRKDGEKWTDAVKRAGTQMKKGTTEVKKTTKTEMQKLLALVKRRKDLKGLAGKTNIPRDAVRKALPSGKRTSATGKVYYENRANRTDKGKVGNYYLELGGTVVTDLAGHTSGGDMGLNANMPLNGFSNTHYTGQVGETGAMSSGEMFMSGGRLTTNRELLEAFLDSKKELKVGNLTTHYSTMGDVLILRNYGTIIATRQGKKVSINSKKYSNTTTTITNLLERLANDEGMKVVKISEDKFEFGGGLPQGAEQSYVNYYLGEGTAQGIYKEGGSIPNNYEGRTAKDVWNNLSTSQRHHFLHDHNKSEIQSTPMSIEDFTKKSYNFLPTKVKKSFENHVRTGQYSRGGGLGKAHYISNRDISGLTTKTGQRLKGSDLLDGAYTNKDIKTPKMSRTQFEDESYEYKNGGMFGGRTYQKGQPLINDRNHINASEKYEGHYASKHPNPKRGHYNKMKVSRTQFEDDTYEFKKGGAVKGYSTGGGLDTPRIYVADLEAYNNGKLQGEWLDLADYNDADELMEAIQELLDKWGVEEYAIHDVEYVPSNMYSEYMGKRDFEELYEMIDLAKEHDLPLEVVQEIVSQFDASAVDEFQGKYDNAEDFAQQLVDDIGIESFTDFEYYLDISETDRRLLAQEMADSYADDIRDEDGGNRLIEEAGLDVEEYEEADSETQEEMLDKAREIVYDEYYETWYDGLDDPYNFLVNEQGMYDAESFANANFVRIDFEKLADALEQDYTFIEHDGDLYVFNIQ
jgi:antirestriction protein